MLIKYSGLTPRDVPAPSPDRWSPRRAAPILLGALLVTLALSYANPHATAISGTPRAGCVEVSPGAVNLLGAMEGQPPVPDRGVLAQGGCATR
ncbi:MAG: hypothetical protein QOI68_2584 [Pseudonocardiales bacterium]|nr:hypothetical protein [Pseudonocardiales bacterium]MDT7681134.1 hypothetical protein [Pseudonocardiales bacterium]